MTTAETVAVTVGALVAAAVLIVAILTGHDDD